MSIQGRLGSESKSRAELAYKIFKSINSESLILTIGWDYRNDSDIPIAKAMKDFLILKGIDCKNIHIDINSRDTVGDAIFSKINFYDKYLFEELHIVTSDYHVERTKFIFEKIMPCKIIVHGGKTDKNPNKKISEKESLEAFKNTFSNANFKSNQSLVETLIKKHPFYNGQVYEQFKTLK
tara:strand:+ start:271 stop:810 length:540 start_codon:yes stop_codon:yes gene_type:complete